MKKTIYYISPITNEYIKSKEVDTRFFGINMPNTTEIKPLKEKENFAICFIKDKWEYVEDNRTKTVYSIIDKTESKVDYLGSIKDGFTLLVPGQFDEWKNDKWIENIEDAKKQSTLDMEFLTQENIDNLTRDYPQFEKDTFNTQETEARAWLVDNNTKTPFLDALSDARDIPKSLMIEKIIANADALKKPVAKMIGAYQKAIS